MARQYNNLKTSKIKNIISWGCSSPGRALEWHSRGKGFDPPHLHHKRTFESVFSFEGHNYVVCNCVATKPPRAGAHKSVQAHLFYYYGTLCLHPSLAKTTSLFYLNILQIAVLTHNGFRCKMLILELSAFLRQRIIFSKGFL